MDWSIDGIRSLGMDLWNGQWTGMGARALAYLVAAALAMHAIHRVRLFFARPWKMTKGMAGTGWGILASVAGWIGRRFGREPVSELAKIIIKTLREPVDKFSVSREGIEADHITVYLGPIERVAGALTRVIQPPVVQVRGELLADADLSARDKKAILKTCRQLVAVNEKRIAERVAVLERRRREVLADRLRGEPLQAGQAKSLDGGLSRRRA